MTSAATASLPVQQDTRHWISGIWHVGVYSASRLALNATPAVLTIVVVRIMPAETARTLLAVLAAATFLTNILSTWLELVLYRFPVQRVRAGVRRLLLLESAAVVVVLALAPAAWAGASGASLRILLFVVVSADLVYRAGAAALQMAGEDRAWIRLNAVRAFVDIAAATVVALMSRNAVFVLCTMVIVRIGFGLEILRISPLYGAGRAATGGPSERWIRYGLSVSLWIAILQVLQYLPQFLAIRFLGPVESTAFLASFRIFFQTSLLMTGILLLYVHPKLFQCFQEHGAQRFYLRWSEWLLRYSAVICGFSLLGVLCYPSLAPLLLTGAYASHATAVLITVPGIVSLSMANYVQKLLEMRDEVLPMAFYLAIAGASFVLLALVARPTHSDEGFARALCACLSFAFTLYLGLVSLHTLRMRPALPSPVLRSTRLIGGGACVGLAALLGVLVAA